MQIVAVPPITLFFMDGDMDERRSQLPVVVTILALLLASLYIGSYLALARPGLSQVRNNKNQHPEGVPLPFEARYRVGGGFAYVFYWPLNQIDRKLRPGAWGEPQ
jgi:hypothetical protein